MYAGALYFTHYSEAMFFTGPIMFEQNSAKFYGAVMSVYKSEITCNGSLSIRNNAGAETVSIVHSKGHLEGIITFIGNGGSL